MVDPESDSEYFTSIHTPTLISNFFLFSIKGIKKTFFTIFFIVFFLLFFFIASFFIDWFCIVFYCFCFYGF